MHFWCEAEGDQHPVFDKGKGVYEFDASRDWVVKIAPFANVVIGVLKVILPNVLPQIKILQGTLITGTGDVVNEINFAEMFNKSVSSVRPNEFPHLETGALTNLEREGILALHAKLRELDPNYEKLGLHCIATYTGEYRWLCKEHYDKAQPKIPDVITPHS